MRICEFFDSGQRGWRMIPKGWIACYTLFVDDIRL